MSGFIRRFFTGKLNEREMDFILITALLWIIIFFLIAQYFYANYSPFRNFISDQGNFEKNPRGFIFFSIACSGCGILIIPYFLYLYRRYYPETLLLLRIATALAITGCVGFIGVGIIPENFHNPHDIAADIAFGGFDLSAICYLFIYIKRLKKEKNYPFRLVFALILVYAVFFGLGTLTGVFPGLRNTSLSNYLDTKWFSAAFWQWMHFVNVLIWIYSTRIFLGTKLKKSR